MEITELKLDDLVLDPNLNLRDRLDEDTVARYIEAWNRLPPVTVFEVEGQLLMADGFHRHAAAVTMGRRTIPGEVRIGTFTEALDYVAGANLFHGLPLTRAERRRAIELKLKLHHERSDRHLSEELCVGRELIAKIRRQLIEGGQIPASTTRLGADGKTYPSLPKDPGERKPGLASQTGQDDPRNRGGRESDPAPWDDTTDPLPPITKRGTTESGGSAPWDSPDARAIAAAPSAHVAAPTIDEMLALMTKQIMDVVTWSQADGFADAYRTASANSRGLFQTASFRLAARADQLRKA